MSRKKLVANGMKLALALIALASFACANMGGGGGSAAASTADDTAAAKPAEPAKPAAPAAPAADAPPAGHPLAKIEPGMSDDQVVSILGPPDHQNAYITGKAFIPFNYGAGDTSRTDFFYKGKGRVTFTRNQWNGRLKVVKVTYNPNEMK